MEDFILLRKFQEHGVALLNHKARLSRTLLLNRVSSSCVCQWWSYEELGKSSMNSVVLKFQMEAGLSRPNQAGYYKLS